MRNPIPCAGFHRNVPLHNFQDERRIEIVKGDIDAAFELQGRLRALVAFADDVRRAPESRCLAASLALADLRRDADRRRKRKLPADPEFIESIMIGLTCESWRSPTHFAMIFESLANPACMPVKRDTPLPSLSDRLAATERVEGNA